MCSVKAPKPTVIAADKPTFARNPFLDELDGDVATADALRRGRSSLVIPGNNDGIGFEGRGGATGGSSGGTPNGNSRTPRGRSPGSPGGGGAGTPFAPGIDYTPPRNGGGSKYE